MDDETLLHLLRGGHISMPERLTKGIWPHPPLTMDSLIAAIRTKLEGEGWFPHSWIEPGTHQVIDEAGTIERSSDNYVYRAARAHPLNPTVLADQVEKHFTSADAAIRCYLKWTLHLPGDLDGWKVVE